jgi:hypothetical protein
MGLVAGGCCQGIGAHHARREAASRQATESAEQQWRIRLGRSPLNRSGPRGPHLGHGTVLQSARSCLTTGCRRPGDIAANASADAGVIRRTGEACLGPLCSGSPPSIYTPAQPALPNQHFGLSDRELPNHWKFLSNSILFLLEKYWISEMYADRFSGDSKFISILDSGIASGSHLSLPKPRKLNRNGSSSPGPPPPNTTYRMNSAGDEATPNSAKMQH